MSQPETILDRVLSEIATITGFDAREYRPTTLKRRLEVRLSTTRSKNYKDYLVYLNVDPSESYKLLDALFIIVKSNHRSREREMERSKAQDIIFFFPIFSFLFSNFAISLMGRLVI